jgi:erythronate-4-phosphate dehydrogenase
MKIIADWNIPLVKEVFSHLGGVELVPGREISPGLVRDADVLVVRSVTRVNERLLSGSSVRFVATATSGADHVDREYLRTHQIGFAYAPGSNAQSVAEYTFAAMVYCGLKHSFGFKDKVLGIIGVGHIGKRVLHMARVLGMRCLCNDPPRARKEGSGEFVTLDALLPDADIVTIHVPLTREGPDATLRMVDETFLKKMKPGAFLFNTSRGKVVDERALKKMRGELGGLVLDVWDNEPSIDTDLLEMTDCGTPHIAGYSYDGRINGTGMVYQAVCDFLGREPHWRPSDQLDAVPTRELRLSSPHVDPLSDLILQAYPIGRDIADMRQLAALRAEEQGAYFSGLREDYNQRLEFNHFSIDTRTDGGMLTDSARHDLSGLGFHLE